MKPANIGGQAVLEGIMMKHQDIYAVAVRREDGSIGVEKSVFSGMTSRYPVLGRTPFVRGILQFIDSMVLGMKSLEIASDLYENKKTKRKEAPKFFQGLSMGISVFLGIGLFMVVPYLLSHLFQIGEMSYATRTLLEGGIRLGIFVLYIWGVSQVKEVRRTFMYHGAEHKCINCIEAGWPLTVENVKKSSKEHKRCGTSFFVFIFCIGLILFLMIPIQGFLPRLLLRVLLIPVLAGISYEALRIAGRSKSVLVELISLPGLQFQKLTTKEPDERMIEVAVEAVNQVFDWRKYEEERLSQRGL